MVPKVTGLQEALPKSIGLLSFDGGIAGNMLAGGNQSSGSQQEWAPMLAFCKYLHNIVGAALFLKGPQVQCKYEISLVVTLHNKHKPS